MHTAFFRTIWNSCLTWLELHARWSGLRALGSSGLVRASVLMPAFGYMLLLNDNVHQYLTIKYDGILLHYLPTVWRIWFLFYGSFLLAFATILYSLFCPRQIKRYGTPYEQAGAETEHLHQLGSWKGIYEELQSLYTRMCEWEVSLFTMKRLNMTQPVDEAGYRRATANVLIHSWLVRDIQRPRLRIGIYFLFVIGSSLIALPAAITFLQVCLLLVKRIFA